MSKYNFTLDLKTENALSLIIDMIKPNSKVLEFGCAHGRLTKYLREEMKCEVSIVEIDEEAGKEALKYAHEGFIGNEKGDIEKYIWENEIKDKFDYIIFADVLEHLYNPEVTLQKCKKFLGSNGYIIISLPNIAHNSVIIDLIQDKFNYQSTGLLDDTHIRFFTRSSFAYLLNKNDFFIDEVKATYTQVGMNEFKNDYNDLPIEISKLLMQRKYGSTYQYIYKISNNSQNAINKNEVKEWETNPYGCKVYILEEGQMDFIDENIIEYKYLPCNGIIKARINISKFKKTIKAIRIDPLETNCIIKINKTNIETDKKTINLIVKDTNGIFIPEKKIYVFKTHDPQIHFMYFENANYLNIEFEILDYDYDINKYNDFINVIENRRITIEQKEDYIGRQREELENRRITIEQKEDYIGQQREELENRRIIIEQKEDYIEQQREELENRRIIIEQKENYINEQRLTIQELSKEIERYKTSRVYKMYSKFARDK